MSGAVAENMSRKGADLALLLLGGFRHLAESARAELVRRGYPKLSPGHEFAMRAISGGASSASELGRRLSVSKQAAAKVIGLLEEHGYVTRLDDATDSRRKLLTVTDLGYEAMSEGEAIFDELRTAWAMKIGERELDGLQQTLALLIGDAAIDLNAPGHTGLEED